MSTAVLRGWSARGGRQSQCVHQQRRKKSLTTKFLGAVCALTHGKLLTTSSAVHHDEDWMTIPTVDVGALMRDADDTPAAQTAAKALSEAFARTGFAVITNHGVDGDVIRALRTEALAFFASDDKFAYDRGLGYGHGGYVRFAESGAQLLGDFSKPVDLVESLTLSGLTSTGGEYGYCPEGDDAVPPALKTPVSQFLRQSRPLSRVMLRALELGLGAPRDEILGVADATGAGSGVRLAYYPDPGDVAVHRAAGQMRYGAHVDSSTFTVLNLDPDRPQGLQVYLGDRDAARSDDDADALKTAATSRPNATDIDKDNAHWVDVPFVPDSFVINIGALLSKWTRHAWKASIHRVQLAPGARLSVVTSALGARLDAPPFAGFSIPGVVDVDPTHAAPSSQDAVSTRDFLDARVKLHRPEFADEHGLHTDAAIQAEGAKILALHK
mmetsp:Transcript_2442/g.9346  ORF Transcript_2442/g.9346 Transcript_2442/m.9346 type:complete len:440 (-) Transcript_2442:298-1617(-)|eukprot:CAMPEP_0185706892 /NCGR_PEP_ID=MMETSP1164-20130828/22804_1 /TAXON_ID=1104430 /ORGANISM="Chrysoreinhardia sp, Strain CCMP2950" /LENGTH=439 /DNA_ID=CAMNT_0028374309 /DNA_START=38 /DNA_END=1357 /DNA_ORIENTATION=+